jgi:hypothetical protein
VKDLQQDEPEGPEDVDEHDVSVDEARDPDAGEQPLERPVDRFRRSATGTVVAAGMLGLRDALEGRPEKEEVTIVNEAPAAPPRDLEVLIDFDHPERSVVVVRPPDDDAGESER